MRLPGEVARRLRDEDDAERDAAVEHHGERDVPARATGGADELDADGRSHGGDECGEDGHRPGEDADRDSGEGDVADAVTDERQAPLDEEGTDERRGEADEDGGDERLAHEVEREQVTHGAPPAGGAGR